MTQSVYNIGKLTIKVQGTNRPSTAALQAANERIGDAMRQQQAQAQQKAQVVS